MKAKQISSRPRPRRVLVLVEDRTLVRSLETLLDSAGFAPSLVARLTSFSEVDLAPITAVVVDPELGGLKVLIDRCGAEELDVPVLTLARRRGAQDALFAGVYDHVAVPLEPVHALAAFRRAAERRELAERVHRLERELEAARAAKASPSSRPLPGPDHVIPLRELERRAIQQAMRVTDGNASTAARLLGLPRATLYRRLAAEGLLRGDGSLEA